MRRPRLLTTLTVAAVVASLILTALFVPGSRAASTAAAPSAATENIYTRPAPDFDLNSVQKVAAVRQATEAQLAALETFKANAAGSNPTVRWNDFGGSPDVLMDFASAPSAGTPEEAGRAFLAANAGLFGISNVADLRLVSNVAALGGHLLRFQQTYNGVDVRNGGVGLVMNANNQVVMASGPYFRDVNVNTEPTVSAADASRAAAADLAQFSVALPQSALDLLKPTYESFLSQTSAVSKLEPKLGVYPTADGYRLVWKVAKVSTNPFGVYMISVDAHTGEIVARRDYVKYQQDPLANTGDIYPTSPCLRPKLKDEGLIENDPATGAPCGQERVTLRKFDPTNRATGVNGTLTGTHALVNNILPTKLPFAQAAKGTWHFAKDDPANFEARTNEKDQLAEPAEHQDEINAFFFATYLVEYIDYLHVAGDSKHSRIGQGSFPDDYPNKTVPLPATVHIANAYITGEVPTTEDPQYAQKLQALVTHPDFHLKVLGMDNAIAVPVTAIVQDVTGEKMPVAANPTFYGHGYLLNDTALEGTVPYHEGMHAITTPIAGLEGDDEANALNEGQADMWAFTITNNPSVGDYVINGHLLRKRYRDTGRNPDSIAYIRSALSTLKYSDFGTLPTDYLPEEHYDGEIYMSTMWDVRGMLHRLYPSEATYRRPTPREGTPTKPVSNGVEIFERLFLGSMYILGTTAPDTFVKSRDALIVADQMLYSTNPADADAPGQNRALIEQVFAAHEMGVNARETIANYATISTGVSEFAASQAAPSAPQNVTVEPASATSLRVSWEPVAGAVAYEVLKRRPEMAGRRELNQDQFASEYGRPRDFFAPIREYDDGDTTTTGFTHVAYVDGNQTSYVDNGRVSEIFAPFGIKDLFSHEYVVRSVGGGRNGQQLGVSALSGASRPVLVTQDVTAAIDTAISNATFSGGVFSFDQRLTNARGANSTDKTIYAPVSFNIVSISDPTVSVKNGDAGNTFVFNQALALGQTSAAKRFEFNDPQARMFTFDAVITAKAYAGSTTGTGSQSGDGTPTAAPVPSYSIFREERTGVITAGEPHAGAPQTYGNPLTKDVTWVDVEITTKPDAHVIDAKLSSTTAVDLDFELRTVEGVVLDDSGNTDANEHVTARVKGGLKYILRVKGFTNGPSEFRIVSDQWLTAGSPNANVPGTITPGADGGTTTGGTATLTSTVRRIVRFTVNPLTRSVTFKLL